MIVVITELRTQHHLLHTLLLKNNKSTVKTTVSVIRSPEPTTSATDKPSFDWRKLFASKVSPFKPNGTRIHSSEHDGTTGRTGSADEKMLQGNDGNV